MLHADFGVWARMRGIPVYQMEDGMREPGLLTWLSHLAPSYLVVVGWYHLIPHHICSAYPALGMHASLLPDYSGGAPLVWAMINGEQRTGITLFKMNEGVDAGPVYAQACTPILAEDTIATLYARIEDLGLNLLTSTLPDIAAGRIVPTPQDSSRRRIFPQRCPEDGWIDWTLPAGNIHNFIRAQTRPYPGAFTASGDIRVSIWASLQASSPATRMAQDAGHPNPGTVISDGDAAFVVCGQGSCLQLLEIEINGKCYPAAALPEAFRELGIRILGSDN